MFYCRVQTKMVLYVVIFLILCYNYVEPISGRSLALYQEENNTSIFNFAQINNVTSYDDSNTHIKIRADISRLRVKRQNSGAGKFAEASKMPQLKILRLFLQMFKNFWDVAYVGGRHPLHHNVPKVIVALYKEKVVEFFIPDVGQEKATQ